MIWMIWLKNICKKYSQLINFKSNFMASEQLASMLFSKEELETLSMALEMLDDVVGSKQARKLKKRIKSELKSF